MYLVIENMATPYKKHTSFLQAIYRSLSTHGGNGTAVNYVLFLFLSFRLNGVDTVEIPVCMLGICQGIYRGRRRPGFRNLFYPE